ncbi:MAG: vitamin K epoxide reductase family protein [Patescibacteria group bacterium]
MRVTIIALALLGILISGYSWYQHYGADTGTFCDISTTFSCSVVNRSIYSKFLGVPVAAIGFAGYALLLALALMKKPLWRYVFAAGIMGTIFSAYLTWIEFATLKTFCVLCLISQGAILAIAVLAGAGYYQKRRRYGSEQKN